MITINQYIKLIKDFCNTHQQLHTVSTENEFNFNADSNIQYPVANIEYVTQSIKDDLTVHQFQIAIADIFDPNLPDSELDIYNDCNLIADDIVTYFANQFTADYVINENVSLQKFTNGNVDRVAGVVMVISFTQFREANACIIPTSSNLNP